MDINIVLAFPNIEYFMTIWFIIGYKTYAKCR